MKNLFARPHGRPCGRPLAVLMVLLMLANTGCATLMETREEIAADNPRMSEAGVNFLTGLTVIGVIALLAIIVAIGLFVAPPPQPNLDMFEIFPPGSAALQGGHEGGLGKFDSGLEVSGASIFSGFQNQKQFP